MFTQPTCAGNNLRYGFWYPVQGQSLVDVVQQINAVDENRHFAAQISSLRQQITELQLQVPVKSKEVKWFAQQETENFGLLVTRSTWVIRTAAVLACASPQSSNTQQIRTCSPAGGPPSG